MAASVLYMEFPPVLAERGLAAWPPVFPRVAFLRRLSPLLDVPASRLMPRVTLRIKRSRRISPVFGDVAPRQNIVAGTITKSSVQRVVQNISKYTEGGTPDPFRKVGFRRAWLAEGSDFRRPPLGISYLFVVDIELARHRADLFTASGTF